jgi:hypothetical protein
VRCTRDGPHSPTPRPPPPDDPPAARRLPRVHPVGAPHRAKPADPTDRDTGRRGRASRRPDAPAPDQPQAARSCEALPAPTCRQRSAADGEIVRGAAYPTYRHRTNHRRRDGARRRRPGVQPQAARSCEASPTRRVSTGPATDRATVPAAADPPYQHRTSHRPRHRASRRRPAVPAPAQPQTAP